MASTKLNFKIQKGSTFTEVLRWESDTKVYTPIVNIAKAAPMVVTANAHNIPVGWRVKISNATGMKEVNSPEYLTVTATTSNTLVFNSVNAIGYTSYVSNGILEYNKPTSLEGYTACMQIREKVTSDDVIIELTNENGGILIDSNNMTITINISAADTSTFTFKNAVYSLDLIKGNVVVPFIHGSITLDTKVTR
jgi:hypothetical protein